MCLSPVHLGRALPGAISRLFGLQGDLLPGVKLGRGVLGNVQDPRFGQRQEALRDDRDGKALAPWDHLRQTKITRGIGAGPPKDLLFERDSLRDIGVNTQDRARLSVGQPAIHVERGAVDTSEVGIRRRA